MTPLTLYNMKPEEATNNLSGLVGHYYNHLDSRFEDSGLYKDDPEKRVEIRTIKYHCFDGRRIWFLATVWFDNSPVMIIQNAGREGDDHSDRCITDLLLFQKMCDHIWEITPELHEETPTENLYDINEDLVGLDKFYGHELSEFREVDQ